MNRLLLIILPLSFLLLGNSAQKPAEKIDWLTIDEAFEKTKKEPKLIFIDVYTDWCGWCKKMDATTFVNPKITKLMEEHFHAVKFDAEQKESVEYKGKEYKYVANGRRGYNEFAATILQGKMSYPSYAVLDENLNLVTVIPGYREVKEFEPMLVYLGEKKYEQDITYPDFLKSYNASK